MMTSPVGPKKRLRAKRTPLAAAKGAALDFYLSGMTVREIAHHVGVAHGTISKWSREPMWQAEVAERRAERRTAAVETVDAAALKAVRWLAAFLDAPEDDVAELDGYGEPTGRVRRGADPRVKVAAAKEILDRAGWTPPAWHNAAQSAAAPAQQLVEALLRLAAQQAEPKPEPPGDA